LETGPTHTFYFDMNMAIPSHVLPGLFLYDCSMYNQYGS